MLKRTEITFERETVLLIRGKGAQHEWCSACQRTVVPLTIDETAIVAAVPSRTVFRWVEDGLLHSGETAAGLLWVCPASIPFTVHD